MLRVPCKPWVPALLLLQILLWLLQSTRTASAQGLVEIPKGFHCPGDLRGLCALIKGVIRVLFLSDQDSAESPCCVCAGDHQQLNELLPINKSPRFPVRGGLGTC